MQIPANAKFRVQYNEDEVHAVPSQDKNNNKPLITERPVLVTGVGGFVACHILDKLLERGYHVRGTVRSKSENATRHIMKVYEKYDRLQNGPKLELFVADLLKEGSFDEAIRGCDYVIHTASPFVLDVKDPQKDLVDPAKMGTLNVLRSCEKFGVKKVILTSSIAAVTESGVVTREKPLKVYTEKDWNTESSLTHNPYYYSKTVAEKEAWAFMRRLKKEKGDQAMKLAIICPTLVWGPSHTSGVNQSVVLVHTMLNGEYPLVFNLNWSIVDVRDVATAHLLALENEKAEGRYICGNETITMLYTTQLIRKHFPQFRSVIPTTKALGRIGDSIFIAASYTRPKGLGTYLRSNTAKICLVDNSRIVNELGLTFTPMAQTVKDTVKDLMKWRQITSATLTSRL